MYSLKIHVNTIVLVVEHCVWVFGLVVCYETHRCFSTRRLFNPLGALGLLLRWLAHLVLHCTDKAPLGQNSYLHFWHLLFGIVCSMF